MIFLLDANGLSRTLYHMTVKMHLESGYDGEATADCVERFLNRLEYLRAHFEKIANSIDEPLSLLAVFDGRSRCFRKDLFPEYKAQRKKDEGAYEAVEHSREALANCDQWLAYTSPDGYEADDVIATWAETYSKDHRVVIHSADKDFNQCLVRGRVGIIKRSGVADGVSGGLTGLKIATSALELDKFRYKDFVDKFGFDPDRWIDYQCMVGDGADNIKGARFVGDKKAREIIGKYDDLTEVSMWDLNKRQREHWDEFVEQLPMLRELFTLGIRGDEDATFGEE